MNERVEFVARLKAGERMTDLCREFGISRKTGYKFEQRYPSTVTDFHSRYVIGCEAMESMQSESAKQGFE